LHYPNLGEVEHGAPNGAGDFPVPSFGAIPMQ